MSLVLNDRVRETTTIVGTGNATLLGAAAGYQSFSVIGNANTCYYTISDQAGVNWEVGIGTYVSATPALARTTVLKSSNAGALVSFPAGTKDVFVTYPSDTSVSGGGGGTYPTVQPTLNLDFANSKTVDPRITFVRNSTATYYDGQTTAMAEQNLLLQSNFVASWVAFNSTLTSNIAVAPDGTTTAATLIPTTATGAHGIVQSAGVIGNQYTYSVYGKSNGYTNLQLYADSSGNFNATFDLTAGTAASTGGATVSIVSVGSGWYRCIATFTQASSTRLNVQGFPTGATASNFSNTFTGDGISGIYIWGAQLEQRSTATAYTPTTTAAITNYIPVLMTAAAGVPRLDYNPITGVALGLLIEESRVNLLTYSQSFISHTVVLSAVSGTFVNGETVTASGGGTGKYLLDKSTATLAAIYNGTGTFTGTLTGSTSGATATCGTVTLIWTLTNSTVTAAATIAPDGTQTAFNLVSNTATGLQAIAQTATKAASALVYTSTVHFKANQYTYSWLQISDGAGNGAIVYFNLTTGAISTAVAGIGTAFTALSATTPTSVGNGWYRCNITGTSNTAISLVTQFGSSTNGTSNSVIGNGYSGVFIWGAQAE
jgi:hypothetical protein